jgi:transcriptional regulator with GAF, ATPase, and Fis domain
MDPKLVTIAGPPEGATFTLTDDVVVIGRDPSTRIHIDGLLVSREHCLIAREAGRFTLKDLGSRNGTFVNGVPVKERVLEHGDQILVGTSLLLFLAGAGEAPPGRQSVHLDERAVPTGSTVRLRGEDAQYLKLDELLTGLAPSDRVAHDLGALLKISTAIASIRSLEALQRRLLELTFEIVPAERGAILLAGGGRELTSIFGWDKRVGPDQAFSVSRTVTGQVLREGVAILSNDVPEGDVPGAESLLASDVCSLLAVPLALFEQVLGVIYLDTRAPDVRFDEGHLQLVTGIASVAAAALENARNVEWLESERQRLQADINIEHSMVGASGRMLDVYHFIAKVAPTDSTVLIDGESGTGKELAARALHTNSGRAGRPFVAINCAVLTEALLETELFGHERGAFTGAVAQKRGKFEVAHGGTIFLDEVGELPLALQAKLLRALQEREFERVGGTRAVKVDVRVIAATNKDLKEAIKTGAFRQDLYYRLNVVALTMPPLRERRDDIGTLASHFAEKYGRKCNRRVVGISAEARAYLANHEWPGNVRELENAIERAVVLGSSEVIGADDLPDELLEKDPPADVTAMQYYDAIKAAKRQIVLRAIEQTGGNYTAAARLLGVHLTHLHRLVNSLGLRAMLKK